MSVTRMKSHEAVSASREGRILKRLWVLAILCLVLLSLALALINSYLRKQDVGMLPVFALQFSADGKWLACGGGLLGARRAGRKDEAGAIRVWETRAWGLHLSCREGFSGRVEWLDFTEKDVLVAASDKYLPRGSDIAAGVHIRSWHVAEKKELPDLWLKEMRGTAWGGCAISQTRRLVAHDLYDDGQGLTVGIFAIPEMKKKGVLRGHPGLSSFLAYSPDGKRILSYIGTKGVLCVYDVDSGDAIAQRGLVKKDQTTLSYARFSADGKMVALAENACVYVFTADLKDCLLTLGTQGSTFVDFSPDGKLILVPGETRETVHFYSLATGKVVRTLDKNAEGVNCCAFSPDGRWIAVGCGGHPGSGGNSPGKVRVFEVVTFKLVAELE